MVIDVDKEVQRVFVAQVSKKAARFSVEAHLSLNAGYATLHLLPYIVIVVGQA